MLFLTIKIGKNLRLALANRVVNGFLCCLGFEPFSLSFFFPIWASLSRLKKKKKTVTTRRKPYYFSFSCLESGQYLAAIIFWLCLELPCTSPQQSATWEVGMWGWTVWVCAWEVSCPLGCGPIPGVHWRHLLLVWGVEFFALCILSDHRLTHEEAISPWLIVYPVDA